jgi:hypothetical protein
MDKVSLLATGIFVGAAIAGAALAAPQWMLLLAPALICYIVSIVSHYNPQ